MLCILFLYQGRFKFIYYSKDTSHPYSLQSFGACFLSQAKKIQILYSKKRQLNWKVLEVYKKNSSYRWKQVWRAQQVA